MKPTATILAAVLLAGAPATAGAQMASGPDPDWVSQAKVMAGIEGISIGEAVSRTVLQNKFLAEVDRLSAEPGFAGASIKRDKGGMRLVVRTKRGSPKSQIRQADVASLVDTVDVDRSMTELEADRKSLIQQFQRLKMASLLSLDVENNRWNLTVADAARVNALRASGELKLPDYVNIVAGAPEVGNEATVTGAGRMDNATRGAICTAGFVATYGGKRGVTTAGHCVTEFYGMETHRGLPAGTAYPYWSSSAYDIALYNNPSHTYLNRVTLGDGTSYTITSVASSIPANTSVCVIKRDGTQQCGFVWIPSDSGTGPDGQPYGPWVRIDRYLTQGGDSGGPWLYGGKAFGSHKGFIAPTGTNYYSTFIGAPVITSLGVNIAVN